MIIFLQDNPASVINTVIKILKYVKKTDTKSLKGKT